MRIRPAEARDLPRIAEILVFAKRVAYRPIFQNDFVSFQEMTVLSVLRELERDAALSSEVLVFDDGIVRGMLRRRREGTQVELCELYVDPFFQGTGVGRALMSAFLDEAGKQQCCRAFLWVLCQNETARRFYEAHGFSADGESRLVEGTRVQEMQYSKSIRNS